MIFIDPSVEEVYQTLIENDEIINFLKKENVLITKESLREDYPPKKVEGMTQYIFTNNVATLYNIAEVLNINKKEIKSLSVRELVNKRVAWNDLAKAIGVLPGELTRSIYVNIIYTYKYCYTSSFFQNNKDRFIPENDFYEMEKNPAAMAFYDAMMKEFDKLDYVLNKCNEYYDYSKVPWDLITYLTQLLGFEKSTFDLEDSDENKFRELAKNILDIYRIKGTNYSFELFFEFLGYDIKIHEYYFDRRLYYLNATGNLETDANNRAEFEFYLTTLNPTDNKLENVSLNEIILPSDITPQYSLNEFNDLVKRYGIEAVLGYSPVYETIDENGHKIYNKYTEKVYKYFKTNYIYYEIKLPSGNISARQSRTIAKCLNFLTPSYVMRKPVSTKAKAGETDDTIGFDGDGTKKPDKNGNYGELEILDDEDWTNQFQDIYTKEKNGTLYVSDENSPDGKATIPYYNSLYNKNGSGENYLESKKFRLPIKHRFINKSLNRFLTGALRTPYIKATRIKYFIGKNETDSGIVMYPYYTIPPYIGSEKNVESRIFSKWEEEPVINLTGKNIAEGNEVRNFPTVKDQIKNAHLARPVKYVVNNLNELENTLNELEIVEVPPRTMSFIQAYNYSKAGVSKGELYYKYLKSYDACNILNDNINNLESPEFIKEYYLHPEFYSKLVYGSYVIGDDGKKLYLYRFGNFTLPIKSEGLYGQNYFAYMNSFSYKPIIDYSCSGKQKTYINIDQRKVINMDNLKQIEENIKLDEPLRDQSMDIDFITSRIYYNKEDNSYYRPVRVTCEKSSPFTSNIKELVFTNMSKATEYFDAHSEIKIRNTDFFIKEKSNRGLYTFDYANRTVGDLIYTTDDGQLWIINNHYNIVPYNNFFGKLNIFNNNVLTKEIPEDISNLRAEIDLYDESWFGYDEQADEEDFIGYNSYHKVEWPALNIDKVIGRPIKYSTDKDYEENNLIYNLIEEKCQKTSSGFVLSERSNREKEYLLVKDVKNISPTLYGLYEKSGDNYNISHDQTYKEEKEYYTNTCLGMINCIEENIEKLTGSENNKIDYYFSIEDFLSDYYKIIILNNYSLIPEKIKEDYEPHSGEEYDDEQKIAIKNCYNNIIIQLYSIINNFIYSREITSHIILEKDDYGKFQEIFTEFKEMLYNFLVFVDENNNIVDDYFQQYYYNTLVDKYREKFIEDKGRIDFSIKDVNPMFVTSDYLDKFNGKLGKFNFPLTLKSSSYINNNGIKDSIKLPFFKLNINFDDKKLLLRTTHKDIMKAFGTDYDLYYKKYDLDNNHSSENELNENYSNFFKSVEPVFLYKNRYFYNDINEKTLWQKNKNKLEKYYLKGSSRSYDKNGAPITNSKGDIINDKGSIISDSELKQNRIKEGFEEGSYVIITLDISDVNIPEIFFKDGELNNIVGYLKVRKLNQTFADNEISFPKTIDWIKRDNNNLASEFISFGDDRNFQYIKETSIKDHEEEYLNNLLEEGSKISIGNEELLVPNYTCKAIINDEGKIVLKVPKDHIDNNMEINTMQIVIS